MERFILQKDIHVFGFRVMSSGEGIGEAFEKLVGMLPEGVDRPYYGISKLTPQGLIYIATALETFEGEGEKYKCIRYVIEKGTYLTLTLRDWRMKTERIKELMYILAHTSAADHATPCIEWYKDDNEMVCMRKSKN